MKAQLRLITAVLFLLRSSIIYAQAEPQGNCPHELGFVNSEKTWADPAPPGSLIEVNFKYNTQTTQPSSPFIYSGKIADLVGGGDAALAPSGVLDAVFYTVLTGAHTITEIELRRLDNTGIWNTIPNDSDWILGVANSPNGPLLNAPNGSVNFTVPDKQGFYLFAEDPSNFFTDGTGIALSIRFSDGSMSVQNLTVGSTAMVVINPTWQLAGYIPATESCMAHAPAAEQRCFQVRLVDVNKNPLSPWSIEACEQSPATGVAVK